jgi:hypothetical protein
MIGEVVEIVDSVSSNDLSLFIMYDNYERDGGAGLC